MQNEGTATVIDSGTDYIDVVNVEGTFAINDNVLSSAIDLTVFLSAVTNLTSKTIFEQGETIRNLAGNFAVIEENNLNDGVISNELGLVLVLLVLQLHMKLVIST